MHDELRCHAPMASPDLDIYEFLAALDRALPDSMGYRSALSNKMPFLYELQCYGALPIRVAFDKEANRVGLGVVLSSGRVVDLTAQSGIFQANSSDLDAALKWVTEWSRGQLLSDYVDKFSALAQEAEGFKPRRRYTNLISGPDQVSYLPNGVPAVTNAIPIFLEAFGAHGRIESFESKDNNVCAVLYETFDLHFGFADPRLLAFGCGVHLGPRAGVTGFPSTEPSTTRSYLEEVAFRFARIDEWCRAVLPADYLAAMVEAHGPLPVFTAAANSPTDTEETPS